jgi:hypothetical protein
MADSFERPVVKTGGVRFDGSFLEIHCAAGGRESPKHRRLIALLEA